MPSDRNQIDQIDHGVDQIDHNLDQIDHELDQIDHDLDQIDQIDQRDHYLDQIDHYLDQIDHELDQIYQIDRDLDNLVPHVPLGEVVQDLHINSSTDPTQERCARSNADYTGPYTGPTR